MLERRLEAYTAEVLSLTSCPACAENFLKQKPLVVTIPIKEAKHIHPCSFTFYPVFTSNLCPEPLLSLCGVPAPEDCGSYVLSLLPGFKSDQKLVCELVKILPELLQKTPLTAEHLSCSEIKALLVLYALEKA